MRRVLFAAAALAVGLSACSRSQISDASSCSMVTSDHQAFVKANVRKEIVCIDSQWYVRLDKDKTYSFQDGEVVTVDGR